MKVLDDSSSSSSPLNAPLPFNHITFHFLNNLWTWIAFIFFRIPSPKPQLLPLPPSTSHDHRQPPRLHTSNGAAHDVDGFTKGKMKFTSYYYSEGYIDDDIDGECDETLKITEEEEREGILLEWWERWEKLLRIRNGVNDNGWYTCQDLTVINGNVVRSWDDGFGFSTFANGATK